MGKINLQCKCSSQKHSNVYIKLKVTGFGEEVRRISTDPNLNEYSQKKVGTRALKY